MTQIILITSISDLDQIPNNLLKSNETKIFSFNLEVHLELKHQKIEHIMADNLLDLEERLKIFDKMAEFRTWYSKIPNTDFELEGVNLLKILDKPIMVGISRKSMIYKSLKTNAKESLNGTTVLNTVSLIKGASILRVHDVKEANECIKLISALNKQG